MDQLRIRINIDKVPIRMMLGPVPMRIIMVIVVRKMIMGMLVIIHIWKLKIFDFCLYQNIEIRILNIFIKLKFLLIFLTY